MLAHPAGELGVRGHHAQRLRAGRRGHAPRDLVVGGVAPAPRGEGDLERRLRRDLDGRGLALLSLAMLALVLYMYFRG